MLMLVKSQGRHHMIPVDDLSLLTNEDRAVGVSIQRNTEVGMMQAHRFLQRFRMHRAATGINGDQTDNSAFESGAVYVFTRTAGVWSQQAYVKASNTEAEDFFGVSVALSGGTLAVGALNESSAATGINGNQVNNGASQSGAVYVYVAQ